MEDRLSSGLFQHRYYRISTMLLKFTGQWPYHGKCTRSVIGAAVFLVVISEIIPQTIAVVKHLNDWNFVIECVTPLSFDGVLLTKFFCSILNSKKMLKLLNRIRIDWDILARDRDVDVLDEYAEMGRKLTILYADLSMLRIVGAYATCVLFATQPVIPKIIDVLIGNGSKPGEFPLPIDYLLIDAQQYYFYVVLHSFGSMITAFIILIGHDTLFVIYILHGCGLYAVLGQKLERIGKNKRSAQIYKIAHPSDQPDQDFKDLILYIKRHTEAIEYAQLIDATYAWCFFFVMGFNMFLITVTGLQVVLTTITPQASLKFIVSNIVAMIFLLGQCGLAQYLMEYSIIIPSYILSGEWYDLPLRTQKILLFIIMRCNVPCIITAGKISTMSLELFKTILKTSISYFSVLRSI